MTDNPLDKIQIAGIRLACVIGINEWERLTRQIIEVDVTLHADLGEAGRSDDIEDTVNYRTISHRIVSEIGDSKFGLVESLAEQVAKMCLEDPRVQKVDVNVRKPGAVRHADFVGVDITRYR